MASIKAAMGEWTKPTHKRKASSMNTYDISSGEDDDNDDRPVGAAAAGPSRPVAAAAAPELPEPAAPDWRRALHALHPAIASPEISESQETLEW
jgi:hypothetical protein